MTCEEGSKMAGREKSLRGQVFDKIRSDILKGRYQQGDELVECTIGKGAGSQQNSGPGSHPAAGTGGPGTPGAKQRSLVNGISARDVTDIYLIRSRLEGLCARMAVEKYNTGTAGSHGGGHCPVRLSCKERTL